MSNWREQYQREMAEIVLRDGTPVRLYSPHRLHGHLNIAQYGWQDYDAEYHFKPVDERPDYEYARKDNPNPEPCTPVLPSDVQITELHTYQMEGTGIGSDLVLVLVEGVTCACGKHEDLVWALESTVGEMTLALLNNPEQP